MINYAEVKKKIQQQGDIILERIGQKRKYLIDEYNEKEIEQILKWSYNDKSFEVGNFSLKKGLLILGNVGSGKTMFLKILENSKINPYVYITEDKVKLDYQLGGVKKISQYGYNSYEIDLSKEQKVRDVNKPIVYCFDEFGDGEKIIDHFGTKIDVMRKIIMDRYDEFFDNGLRTIISTNLTMEQIKERYGSRIEDRFNELFNRIIFKGKSRRK